MAVNASSTRYAKLLKYASSAAVLVAGLMILMKLWAWLFTSSVAMLGSLTDSLLDISASLMNLYILRFALKPADDEHRFGHGKAEALAGLGQAAFILGSSVLLIFFGFERVLHPLPSHNSMIGIWVSIVAVGLTILLVMFQQYVIRQTGSVAIKADSLHYKGDILLNLSVLLAFVLTSLGILWSDGVFAILVAFYLAYNAWEIALQSSAHLMDHELPEQVHQKIIELVKAHSEVHGLHDLRTRQSGPIQFIQFHIELDDDLKLTQAHQVSDQIETSLRANLKGELDIIIHHDPVTMSMENKQIKKC